MWKISTALAVIFSLLCAAVPAKGDSLVVQTCGILPLAYAPGATRLDTIDVNGNKCTNATGGGATSSNQTNGTQQTQITDGVNGSVTVKPASTAAVATDKSLVFQLNPLSPGIVSYVDPCQNPGVFKSSVPINVSSATTTALVAVSGTTSVYVCAVHLDIAGSATTANTAKFEYGTGTACATGATALTGTMGSNDAAVSTTPTTINMSGPGTLFTAPSSNGLCIVTTGNAPFDQGWVSYVQQ